MVYRELTFWWIGSPQCSSLTVYTPCQLLHTVQLHTHKTPGLPQPLYYYGRLADVIIGLCLVLFVAFCLPWCGFPVSEALTGASRPFFNQRLGASSQLGTCADVLHVRRRFQLHALLCCVWLWRHGHAIS